MMTELATLLTKLLRNKFLELNELFEQYVKQDPVLNKFLELREFIGQHPALEALIVLAILFILLMLVMEVSIQSIVQEGKKKRNDKESFR